MQPTELEPRRTNLAVHGAAHSVRALLAGAALAVASPLAAQQPPIQVQAGTTLERDTVTVGDVVRLTIRVRAPLGATIGFPTAVDSTAVVQPLEAPTVRNGADSASAVDRIATYRLSAWDIGRQPIRLGDVTVQTDQGDRQVALTFPSLFVRSVLPADTTLRVPKPARPILGVSSPTPWWWWALGALAAVLIGLLAWWIVRRRRGAGATGDPFLDANAEFERIERLRLIEAGERGRHVALMTDVLRRYLAARLEPVSLALTSGELQAVVRSVPTVPHDALRSVFESVDPVKFANAPLSADRARALGEEAKAIVRDEHERAEALAAAEAAAAKKERAA
ncbi:MAG: hypothetical protein M3Z05_09485 [Gemmatimonadota bacterium]|nr:hypothetical protein [Gemmatimonadota bacterium]